jgi:hypothetical protein
MRTVHDLDDAFCALADTAPEPGPLPVLTTSSHAPERGETSRRIAQRWLAPTIAAVGTVALVAGLVWVTADSKSAGPGNGAAGADQLQALTAPAADEAPDLTLRFTATPPAGDTVTSYEFDRAGQVIDFGSAAAPPGCDPISGTASCRQVAQVRLYWANPPKDPDERNFNAAKVSRTGTAEVDGRAAFFGRMPHAADGREKLFWQYAPGAWAEATAPSRAAELALAESVRGATVAVRIPLAPTMSGHRYANVLSSQSSGAGGTLEISSPGAREGGFDVAWGNAATAVPHGKGAAEDITVNGRSWTIRGGEQPRAVLRGATVPVVVSSYLGRSRAELIAFLRGLRLASDLGDPSTWYDAAQVLR